MRLVDWALRQKARRPRDHVGLLGLSYGGYMTNWLLGHHPGRFAAAVSENPVLDLFSFYGESDYGFTIAEHVGGIDEPWDDFARMLDRSPGAQLHRNKAPLLLLQAEGDLRCPAGQTEIAFTMLRRLGRTVEMVRYPDEFHCCWRPGAPTGASTASSGSSTGSSATSRALVTLCYKDLWATATSHSSAYSLRSGSSDSIRASPLRARSRPGAAAGR